MSMEQEMLPLVFVTEQPVVPEVPWALPVFSADRACVKCAGEEIHVHYHDGVAAYEPCYEQWRQYDEARRMVGVGVGWSTTADFPEHFDLRCKRCSYSWCEAVLS